MLILTRRPGESIQIGNNITLTVTRILEHHGRRTESVRLGIEAPDDVNILREELHQQAFNERDRNG